MKHTTFLWTALASLFSTTSAVPAAVVDAAAACTTTLSSPAGTPSVAAGYTGRLVANGLTTPRGLIIDSAGHLLVVQSGSGVVAITWDSQAGVCQTAAKVSTVISDTTLNHGIALSADGATLYVSNVSSVMQYPYSASSATVLGGPTIIINNMTNDDHVSRTLYMSKFQKDTLIVSRGSGANLDPASAIESNGRAQVRAFNLTARTGTYAFQNSGKVLGWGLRNDVGIDEHPVTGGIYTVENSADQLTRNNVDVHNSNPSEELNYLGTLIGNTSPNQGSNFGYPTCFSVWNKSTIPDNSDLRIGWQFAIGTVPATNPDAVCKTFTSAAGIFHPHMAPLDILFNSAGSKAFVTFHGSWDSTIPVGYKVSVVPFVNGSPKFTGHGTETAIFQNANTANCYSTTCIRPVNLAIDSTGTRMFVSSDATGEIWMIYRAGGF